MRDKPGEPSSLSRISYSSFHELLKEPLSCAHGPDQAFESRIRLEDAIYRDHQAAILIGGTIEKKKNKIKNKSKIK